MKKVKSVLLVDDSEVDQNLFLMALEDIPHGVLFRIAGNGKEALDLLRNAAILPDLIFMDINMPVMDGIDCLSEIIKDEKLKNVPVVILSSETTQAAVARKLGARAFIQKPLDGQLRVHIEEMIDLNFNTHGHEADLTFLSFI